MTPRFSSLEYAIGATRRLLRDRLDRYLGREPSVQPSLAAGTVLDDEDMLRLLQSVELGFGSEWSRALRTYQAALTAVGGEPPLEDHILEGWARVVWGRIKVSSDVVRVLRAGGAEKGPLASMLKSRFDEECRLAPNAALQGDLMATAEKVARGETTLRQLGCRSPAWVAARLWDRGSGEAVVSELRNWVDRWDVLGAPEFVPSRVWDGAAADRFRQTALQVLETDPALEDWTTTHRRFVQELAIIKRALAK